MNGARFGPAALALCGLAARLLGWRPAEFWASTPMELATALRLTADGAEPCWIDRATLQRMMENHDGR